MDQRAVAIQLRTLASDPDNQTYIVREKACMRGLINFLDSRDEQLLLISLQALQFLTTHPLNQEPLSKENGLLTKLALIADHENEQIRRVASSTLENLQNYVNRETRSQSHSSQSSQSFRPRYLFNVPLQIPQMNTQAQITNVERVLLSVRGVVSITVERSIKQVVVYSKTQDQDFIDHLTAAIHNIGLEAIVGQGQDKSVVSEEGDNSVFTTPRKPKNEPAYLNKSQATATNVSTNSKENVSQYANPPSIINNPHLNNILGHSNVIINNNNNNNNNIPAANATAMPSSSAAATAAASGYKPQYLNPNYLRITRPGALTEYKGPNVAQVTVEARQKQRQEREQEKAKEKKEKETTINSLFGAVTSYFW